MHRCSLPPRKEPAPRADSPAISPDRGIHLTGPIRACSSPGAVRWRAIQARRVPARLGRRGRHRPGPLGGDKVLVAHRLVGSGEFEPPGIEDHPASSGSVRSKVEARSHRTHSGSCRRWAELHLILGGSPSSQPPWPVRRHGARAGSSSAGIHHNRGPSRPSPLAASSIGKRSFLSNLRARRGNQLHQPSVKTVANHPAQRDLRGPRTGAATMAVLHQPACSGIIPVSAPGLSKTAKSVSVMRTCGLPTVPGKLLCHASVAPPPMQRSHPPPPVSGGSPVRGPGVQPAPTDISRCERWQTRGLRRSRSRASAIGSAPRSRLCQWRNSQQALNHHRERRARRRSPKIVPACHRTTAAVQPLERSMKRPSPSRQPPGWRGRSGRVRRSQRAITTTFSEDS